MVEGGPLADSGWHPHQGLLQRIIELSAESYLMVHISKQSNEVVIGVPNKEIWNEIKEVYPA